MIYAARSSGSSTAGTLGQEIGFNSSSQRDLAARLISVDFFTVHRFIKKNVSSQQFLLPFYGLVISGLLCVLRFGPN